MMWIIQKDFYSKQNHLLLTSVLNNMDIPFIEVELNEVLEKGLLKDNDEYHIVCGGMKLINIAKREGLEPSSFVTKNFNYIKWIKEYGENLLNNEAVIDDLSNIVSVQYNDFFIRPLEDNKFIEGTTFINNRLSSNESLDFITWKKSILNKKNDFKVLISPIKNICAEYRYFIVNQEVISYSQYRLGKQLFINPIVDIEATNFVKNTIQKWSPSIAYVLDIALTDSGEYKIVEINNITSAGFYGCDVSKIVYAINSLFY